jgi:hypothetical protein
MTTTDVVGEANGIFVAHSASCGSDAISEEKPRRGDLTRDAANNLYDYFARFASLVPTPTLDPQLALWATGIGARVAGYTYETEV